MASGDLQIAYFAPFTYENHQDLIAEAQEAVDLDGQPIAQVEVVAQSCDGRDVELVTLGSGPAKVWLIARQHPGESMAEWYMKGEGHALSQQQSPSDKLVAPAPGLLERLLNPRDAAARRLRELATIRLVPNMNPDGSRRGHLRTNAKGANLNREWGNTGDYKAPTLERSPEVFMVLKKLREVGCDVIVDVHGDEGLPHNFFGKWKGVVR